MRSRRGGARSVAPPCPARHARPSLRLGWAAAPASRPGAFPRRLPLGSGWSPPRLRARVPVAGCARPCARSAAPPSPRPFPRSARGSGALWGVLAPLRLGLALASGGDAGSPLPRPPSGGSCALAPPGGLPGAAAPRLFVRSCAPPGFGLVVPPLRRRRVCARSAPFCFAAGESFGLFSVALAALRKALRATVYRAIGYLHKIRRANYYPLRIKNREN